MPWATKPFPNDSRSLYPQSIINKNKIIHTVKNLKTKPKVTRHLGSVLWSAVTHKSQLRLFYKIWATPEHRFQEDTAANTIQGGFSWTVLQHRQTQAHLVSVAPWQSYDFGCQCYGQKGTLQAQRCGFCLAKECETFTQKTQSHWSNTEAGTSRSGVTFPQMDPDEPFKSWRNH